MVDDARLPSFASAGARRVTVAVPTFRRPALLEALLHGLARQVPLDDESVEVTVFDNDQLPSAGVVVAAARAWFPFPLHYVHVPEPGLSAVRNAVLNYAGERADVLVTIDDDECPEPQWLRELLRVQGVTGADVVIGPVPQVLPATAPAWLRKGRFLDLPTFPDAAPLSSGYSGNALIVASAPARFGVRFEAALNFAGGEDLLFFRQLASRGAKLAFAARAVASESAGAERLRLAYVIKLNFRRGNTLALCDRHLDGRASTMLLRAGKAYARLALGWLSLVPLALTRGRVGAVSALCNLALGLGGLSALLGYTYHAYRRNDLV